MAQQRQSGTERLGVRHDLHNTNGSGGDHVSVAIRGGVGVSHKQQRFRRSARSDRGARFTVVAILVFLFLVLVVTFLAFSYISREEIIDKGDDHDTDEVKNDSDFLTNVPRIEKKVLGFGHASGGHGRDSRYWDKDDRRRDGDYDEDMKEQISRDLGDANAEDDARVKTNLEIKSSQDGSYKGLKRKGVGLYNEAGRHELKRYEAEYEASLKNVRHSAESDGKLPHDADMEKKNAAVDIDDEYDDFFDAHDGQTEESADGGNMSGKHVNSDALSLDDEVQKESHGSLDNDDIASEEDIDGESSTINKKKSRGGKTNSRLANTETKRKGKHHKHSGEAYSSP
ncbi:hypothetical protein L195_g005326 [Trifolium pratense]|uniref:Uncharacterized protein n=1 Tax=Trifolium pratense TaxID=57577 RepID=A0A2K3P0H2_TRIPR|nr:hypothetical protein L195_g005326 [Trifolium pratense]